MKIKFYQVDAFADKIFEGNPAAVCPLDEDSVTGSAYTQLMPYWAKRLGKNVLSSKQLLYTRWRATL